MAKALKRRPETADDVASGRRTGLTRADVITAALDLVNREGAAALSMRRLATDLGVGTPTVYWHVSSREELVAEVIRLQSSRMADHPIEGATAHERVYAAAHHMWSSMIEHRAVTSLAHQTGMSSLLAHDLEAALVVELEAAGLEGDDAAEAFRVILIAVGGALLLALRDATTHPADARPDALWAGSTAPIAAATRAALRANPDMEAVSAAALRAAVEHFVPA